MNRALYQAELTAPNLIYFSPKNQLCKDSVLVHIISDTFSFPFLGEIAAATIIGIIKNIERCPDKKKFKKALGVYSNLTQSGGSPGRTRQGRVGPD